jgi:hypothetical protein
MRRKNYLILFLTIVFSGFLSSGVIFADPNESEDDGITIYCKCTTLGRCKASGSGPICAQGQSGGNIHCQDYNGNC